MHRVLQPPTTPAVKGRVAHILRRLGALARGVRRAMSEPWKRRAAIAELQRFSARQLRDAGIERHEIEALVDDMLAAGRRDE